MKSKNLRDAGVLVLATLAGLTVWFGLWYGLLGYIPAGGQRLIAAIAVGLLPFTGALGLILGLTRSRDHLKGLEQGVGVVMDAANKASDVKVQTAQAIRPGRTIYPAQSVASTAVVPRAAKYDELIPPVERAVVVHRKPGSSEDVMEL